MTSHTFSFDSILVGLHSIPCVLNNVVPENVVDAWPVMWLSGTIARGCIIIQLTAAAWYVCMILNFSLRVFCCVLKSITLKLYIFNHYGFFSFIFLAPISNWSGIWVPLGRAALWYVRYAFFPLLSTHIILIQFYHLNLSLLIIQAFNLWPLRNGTGSRIDPHSYHRYFDCNGCLCQYCIGWCTSVTTGNYKRIGTSFRIFFSPTFSSSYLHDFTHYSFIS